VNSDIVAPIANSATAVTAIATASALELAAKKYGSSGIDAPAATAWSVAWPVA
jgi:hypothetical protein